MIALTSGGYFQVFLCAAPVLHDELVCTSYSITATLFEPYSFNS